MGDLVLSGNLMAGRRGLVMGVANDHSIAWGIARTLRAHGAELAFTYQNDAFEKRVRPLAESVDAALVVKADVEDDASLDRCFSQIDEAWNRLDFVVHAVAYSDKAELKGRYLDTTRANFRRSLDISCYSFTDLARRAEPLLLRSEAAGGGSLLTLTYLGAQRVMPNYNVMGVAKAALEASVRYLAVDLGHNGIRVNGISAGPMRTLAGSAIGDARMVFKWNRMHAALKKNVDLDEIGGSALYLLSDLSAGVTGEIHYVDSGFNVIAMPRVDDLKAQGMTDHGLKGNGANGHGGGA
ncbi:MAG: SDR family oxidoreductase [Alphaproteobacteria bacterium]